MHHFRSSWPRPSLFSCCCCGQHLCPASCSLTAPLLQPVLWASGLPPWGLPTEAVAGLPLVFVCKQPVVQGIHAPWSRPLTNGGWSRWVHSSLCHPWTVWRCNLEGLCNTHPCLLSQLYLPPCWFLNDTGVIPPQDSCYNWPFFLKLYSPGQAWLAPFFPCSLILHLIFSGYWSWPLFNITACHPQSSYPLHFPVSITLIVF